MELFTNLRASKAVSESTVCYGTKGKRRVSCQSVAREKATLAALLRWQYVFRSDLMRKAKGLSDDGAGWLGVGSWEVEATRTAAEEHLERLTQPRRVRLVVERPLHQRLQRDDELTHLSPIPPTSCLASCP
jgi:hypothetical protein